MHHSSTHPSTHPSVRPPISIISLLFLWLIPSKHLWRARCQLGIAARGWINRSIREQAEGFSVLECNAYGGSVWTGSPGMQSEPEFTTPSPPWLVSTDRTVVVPFEPGWSPHSRLVGTLFLLWSPGLAEISFIITDWKQIVLQKLLMWFSYLSPLAWYVSEITHELQQIENILT